MLMLLKVLLTSVTSIASTSAITNNLTFYAIACVTTIIKYVIEILNICYWTRSFSIIHALQPMYLQFLWKHCKCSMPTIVPFQHPSRWTTRFATSNRASCLSTQWRWGRQEVPSSSWSVWPWNSTLSTGGSCIGGISIGDTCWLWQRLWSPLSLPL